MVDVAVAAGAFGYDDEGVAATSIPIVSEGIFQGFLSSREMAAELEMTRSGALRLRSFTFTSASDH